MTAQQAAAAAYYAQRPSPNRHAKQRGPQHSFGARVVRTAIVAVLVAGVGSAARFGWDAYQDRSTDTSEFAETTQTFLPPLGSPLPTGDPLLPVGGYIDFRFAIDNSATGQATTGRVRESMTSTHHVYDLSFRDTATDPADEIVYDIRGERVVAQVRGSAEWFDVPDESVKEELEELVSFSNVVLTMHDLVPIEMHPFVSVLAETDEELQIVPLSPAPPPPPAIDTSDELVVVPATTIPVVTTFTASPGSSDVTRPPGPVPVRHYQLQIDAPAFAAAEPAAYSDWVRLDFISGTTDTFDIWIDDLGIVRQFEGPDQGWNFSYTLNDVAYGIPGFQTNVVIVTPQFRVLEEP